MTYRRSTPVVPTVLTKRCAGQQGADALSLLVLQCRERTLPSNSRERAVSWEPRTPGRHFLLMERQQKTGGAYHSLLGQDPLPIKSFHGRLREVCVFL